MNEGTASLSIYTLMIIKCVLGGLAMGGVIMGAVVLARPWARVALALLLSVVTYLLFHSQADAAIFQTPGGDIVAFAVLALVTLAVAEGIFALIKGLRPLLARTLDPEQWGPRPGTPLTSEDFAKRWFVTVAAATGGLVGNLTQNEEFLARFRDAFDPTRILFTVIMTVVSITLIGPVEDYIFRAGSRASEPQGHGGTHSSHFETLIQQLSWRALGRLGLVLVLVMQLNILHVSLEAAVDAGKNGATLVMVISSLSPAIVTYFWSAALQRGAFSIARRTIIPVTLAGFILTFPASQLSETIDMMVRFPNWSNPAIPAIEFVVAIAGALKISIFYFGIMALVGGWALDTERRRSTLAPVRTIAVLTLALAVAHSVGFLIQIQLNKAVSPVQLFTYRDLPLSLLPTIGWGAGLLVSGFPDILKRASAVEQAPVEVSGADDKLAMSQGERAAMAVERRRNWELGKVHVRETWMAQSKAQRYTIMAGLVVAPLMLILFAVYGDEGKPKSVLVGPDGLRPPIKIGIDNLRPTAPLTAPTDLGSLGSGTVPGLNPALPRPAFTGWQHLAFTSGPNAQGVGFVDDANETQGALVCDDNDNAAMARVWILVSETRYSELRDEGKSFIVDGRTIAKQLTLDIDGHDFALSTPTIITSTKGRTMLTAFYDPDQAFFDALKHAGQMVIASGERALIIDSSGHDDRLTQVAMQCIALGTPF